MKEKVPRNRKIVLLLTGHGLEDIDSATKNLSFPKVCEPYIDAIMKSLGISE
jgi:hypothetical protein